MRMEAISQEVRELSPSVSLRCVVVYVSMYMYVHTYIHNIKVVVVVKVERKQTRAA
jgi:hypothetical protein